MKQAEETAKENREAAAAASGRKKSAEGRSAKKAESAETADDNTAEAEDADISVSAESPAEHQYKEMHKNRQACIYGLQFTH